MLDPGTINQILIMFGTIAVGPFRVYPSLGSFRSDVISVWRFCAGVPIRWATH